MKTQKVQFDSLVRGDNHRKINRANVDAIKASMLIPGVGLMSNLEVVSSIDIGKDGEGAQKYKINKGEHRYEALCELRDSTNPEHTDVFAQIVKNGKLEVDILEADSDTVKARAIVDNTGRKNLSEPEYYDVIVSLTNDGKDQYEVAALVGLQQPRVAEYLTFQKVHANGHALWRDGVIARADMLNLASLEGDAQEFAIAALGATQTAGSVADVKKAKAEARKAVKKAVKAKGGKREYANAGKPTRQKLASYVPMIAVRAATAKTAEERAFNNAFAAAFKLFNGELEFDKITFDKSYVTKKDAAEAQKLLDDAAAKAEEKAAKLAAKAAKAAEKKKAKPAKKAAAPKKAKPAKKAAAPKKAAKKAAAPKKAPAKKAAKKAPKKAAKKPTEKSAK